MSFKTAFFAFLKREKSQADLDAYQRACTQIDDLDAAIQTEILDAAPGLPWDRAQHQQQAMAYAWIARGLSTIATSLLETDEKTDPSTAGYLPIVTYTQARELYVQVPEYAQRAWEAMVNASYQPDRPLPMPLGPRIEADGKCPLAHLRGIHAAAEALDAFAEVRLNSELALVRRSGSEAEQSAKKVLDRLAQIRARARSARTFANDQLAAIAEGKNVSLETHEDAETRLWSALSDQFLLGQVLAMPKLADAPALLGESLVGRKIPREDRWFLADAQARRDLEGKPFGEQEIVEFWTRKGWRTTALEERYFAQCKALVEDGSITAVSRWSTCPFDPVYQTLRPVNVLDTAISARHEFHLDMDENRDEITLGSPRFRRTDGYEEEHEEGHVGDSSEG